MNYRDLYSIGYHGQHSLCGRLSRGLLSEYGASLLRLGGLNGPLHYHISESIAHRGSRFAGLIDILGLAHLLSKQRFFKLALRSCRVFLNLALHCCDSTGELLECVCPPVSWHYASLGLGLLALARPRILALKRVFGGKCIK